MDEVQHAARGAPISFCVSAEQVGHNHPSIPNQLANRCPTPLHTRFLSSQPLQPHSSTALSGLLLGEGKSRAKAWASDRGAQGDSHPKQAGQTEVRSIAGYGGITLAHKGSPAAAGLKHRPRGLRDPQMMQD